MLLEKVPIAVSCLNGYSTAPLHPTKKGLLFAKLMFYKIMVLAIEEMGGVNVLKKLRKEGRVSKLLSQAGKQVTRGSLNSSQQ